MLQSKAPHVRSQFTPKPEFNIKSVDPRKVDFSPEHAAKMASKLYARDQPKQTKLHGFEAGSLSSPYADEVLPAWKSTVKADYVPKLVDRGLEQIDSVSKYIKSSHFKLEGPGDVKNDDAHWQSTTRRDYLAKSGDDAKPVSAKPDPSKSISPIVGDETILNHNNTSVYKESFAKARQVKLSAPQKFGGGSDPTRSHFSLGDDPVNYSSKSITGEPAPVITDHFIVRPPRTKSTVLECPDWEKGEYISVAKKAYGSNLVGVDPKTLTVEKEAFTRDLKSTHFTLGTDVSSLGQAKSQYSSSFLKKQGAVTQPTIYKSSYRDDVHLEEDEDRRMSGLSSTRTDYVKHEAASNAAHSQSIKDQNSRSSIFTDGNRSMESASVAASSYLPPSQEKYTSERTTASHPGMNPYPLLAMESNTHSPGGKAWVSVAKSDFTIPKDPSSHARALAIQNKMGSRYANFDLGLDDRRYVTSTSSAAYKPASLERTAAHRPDLTFGATLENVLGPRTSISGSEMTRSATTTGSAYVPMALAKVQSIKPPPTMTQLCMELGDAPMGMSGSTESRRAFVNPVYRVDERF
ncbi:hypothetical protein SmJEL517_g02755 [Synchytrium microbalum]|uniref:Uncharacterized protein n=1 Tax=Synchytrium microbalum TaxID=1806994 RepID=A0A507C9V2_9FUNG|nr:uncharacterized protein SmJEL517_g02755 [Synchytrium microbalum]TPX34754.1 hypothetical protein SmJEL517_g02755 [Synchytrium microbalum]